MNCGTGWKHASISSNGKIKSCLLLNNNEDLGDLSKDNIADIFKTDKVSFFANFTKSKDDANCNDCTYKDFCNNCIARIYVSNLQRIKQGMDLCPIVYSTNMYKYFDFNNRII
jgi:radical SAM protein with 4Fe4S-binding SPASM domain